MRRFVTASALLILAALAAPSHGAAPDAGRVGFNPQPEPPGTERAQPIRRAGREERRVRPVPSRPPRGRVPRPGEREGFNPQPEPPHPRAPR